MNAVIISLKCIYVRHTAHVYVFIPLSDDLEKIHFDGEGNASFNGLPLEEINDPRKVASVSSASVPVESTAAESRTKFQF